MFAYLAGLVSGSIFYNLDLEDANAKFGVSRGRQYPYNAMLPIYGNTLEEQQFPRGRSLAASILRSCRRRSVVPRRGGERSGRNLFACHHILACIF